MNYCACENKSGKPELPLPSTVDRKTCGRCGRILNEERYKKTKKSKLNGAT